MIPLIQISYKKINWHMHNFMPSLWFLWGHSAKTLKTLCSEMARTNLNYNSWPGCMSGWYKVENFTDMLTYNLNFCNAQLIITNVMSRKARGKAARAANIKWKVPLRQVNLRLKTSEMGKSRILVTKCHLSFKKLTLNLSTYI